ncbi:hypothetical protein H1V43_12840 [Streptomyces sp. PSKA54]|uniref:Secreted protein n=1 Tax=Streptomyces himalayensis subsp. aureolus TaxID=2758039 RepID=A0A7W2CZZ9_9ACTN|nr:hypothetical protein [Streptomyces himalayensis]MBA4862257.1 hypothetical protein [Streptomyces himalayensis subsp. aureolus]
MQRHKLRTAVTLCAAAALAAVAPASTSAGASSPTPDPDPVLVDCFFDPQVRPDDFILACGDGNNRLVDLRWSSWGPAVAEARGVDLVNDCRPYCAVGKFHAYPVTVKLDRPEPWEKDPDQDHYTRMRLVYTDDKPAQADKEETFKLWD